MLRLSLLLLKMRLKLRMAAHELTLADRLYYMSRRWRELPVKDGRLVAGGP